MARGGHSEERGAAGKEWTVSPKTSGGTHGPVFGRYWQSRVGVCSPTAQGGSVPAWDFHQWSRGLPGLSHVGGPDRDKRDVSSPNHNGGNAFVYQNGGLRVKVKWI